MLSAAVARKTCPRCGRTSEADSAFCPNDGTALDAVETTNADPYIGTVIQGDIEILAVAGVGAMGRVYRAHQRGIERNVAVKILHRELSGNQPLVQRFHREAKIASKLQHPHVVDVYFTGQLPDGALYIVMEYLDGMSLAAAFEAAGKRLPIERVLNIVLQICDAVGEGHSRGIIHRDLKPENVMLVRRAETSDWVKVLDFGIAKVSVGEQSMETAAGLIFGTARYISPEGAQGAVVGPPGDVYAIAVILYQLLTGETPFDAPQPVGLLVKHIHDAPPPLRSMPGGADVPEAIARVVMGSLAKAPEKRAPNARAYGAALTLAAKEASVAVVDVGVGARMSLVDVQVGRRAPVERTLDDADMLAAPKEVTAPAEPAALADTAVGVAAPVVEATAPPAAHTAPSTGRGRSERRSTAFIVLLAFLLGGAVTGLVMQYTANRTDPARSAHLTRARKALVKGHFVEPPGENVRELVSSGLTKWPDDASFIRIQSDAAHELVTHAMAERSGGDVQGALDLAKTAREVDPSDGAAKLLLAQYEAELATLMSDGGAPGPRVTLAIPSGPHRPGVSIELDAGVMTGPTRHKVSGARFLVTGPGLPASGLTLPTAGSYRVAFTPPGEGDYEVHFEANVEGVSVRANRTLTVVR